MKLNELILSLGGEVQKAHDLITSERQKSRSNDLFINFDKIKIEVPVQTMTAPVEIPDVVGADMEIQACEKCRAGRMTITFKLLA